jgi:hypothetical protein
VCRIHPGNAGYRTEPSTDCRSVETATGTALRITVSAHRRVLKSILKKSELSGRRAEAQFVARCEFTGVLALTDELETSQVSDKRYRRDRQQRSIVSGKTGYRDEFVQCAETGQLQEESVASAMSPLRFHSQKHVSSNALPTCDDSVPMLISL